MPQERADPSDDFKGWQRAFVKDHSNLEKRASWTEDFMTKERATFADDSMPQERATR